METELLEIKSLIERLRDLDTLFVIFGAKGHHYRIGPTLSEAQIETFERQYEITLPPDYRLYLQIVGNGNGNSTKEWFIEEADGTARIESLVPDDNSSAGPNYGLYHLALTVDEEHLNVAQPFPFEVKTEIQNDSPYREWGFDVPGTLEISTSGCANSTRLVISGPATGTVWESWENTIFTPTHQTFGQWMRSWALSEIRSFEKSHPSTT